MKITSIELWPDGNTDYISFDFKNVKGTNPYFLKDASGLDADEIIPQFYGQTPEQFYNMKLRQRVMVFKLGLRPNFSENETYASMRDYIYKMIASSRTGKVKVIFINESEQVAFVEGFVIKYESPQFQQKQEVQLTIACLDPMLRGIDPINVPLLGADPAGTVINDSKSTAFHGIALWIHVLSPTIEIAIRDPSNPTWVFDVKRVGGFTTDDIVVFNTEPTSRSAWMLRGDDIIQIADAIVPGSVWPVIFPGNNLISIDNPTRFEWQAINFTPAYWGV